LLKTPSSTAIAKINTTCKSHRLYPVAFLYPLLLIDYEVIFFKK